MNNRRWLFLVFVLLATAVAAYATTSPIFQVRLAVDAAPDAPPPPNSDKMNLRKRDRATGRNSVEVLYVDRKVLLDQSDLKKTRVATNDSGQPVIDITFTEQGRQRFVEITRQNTDWRLAIIIAGQVYSAPVIRDEIAGGQAQLSGDFTQSEAENLSNKINAVLKP